MTVPPRNYPELRAELQARMPGLAAGQRRIARVLLADPDVGAIGDGLAVIAKQGAGFPERRVQIGGSMTVIYGQNNASAKTRGDLSHPP